jgi:hypothetical protein
MILDGVDNVKNMAIMSIKSAAAKSIVSIHPSILENLGLALIAWSVGV